MSRVDLFDERESADRRAVAEPSLVEALGFERDARVLNIHFDDVGMCLATVEAFDELIEIGAVSSGSVMVPCPWFPRVVELCRRRPGIDLGVHLTLTSEWKGYRWSAVSTRDSGSGLLDADGYLHPGPDELYRQWLPEAARRELDAQLQRALAAGLDVTHLDSHQYVVYHPELLPHYFELGARHGLPVLVWHPDGEVPWFRAAGQAPELLALCRRLGLPVADRLALLWIDGSGDPVAQMRRLFDELPPGLTQLLVHPAHDTPELRAITSSWRDRVAEYEALRHPEVLRHRETSGVQLVGYRELGELLSAAPSSGSDDAEAASEDAFTAHPEEC